VDGSCGETSVGFSIAFPQKWTNPLHSLGTYMGRIKCPAKGFECQEKLQIIDKCPHLAATRAELLRRLASMVLLFIGSLENASEAIGCIAKGPVSDMCVSHRGFRLCMSQQLADYL
jgi:hypothetical protein